MSTLATRVSSRLTIRRDLPEVLEIERLSFKFPWSEEDFIRTIRCRANISRSAEHEEQVVGFFVYRIHADQFELLNLAVHPKYRREGIGRYMLENLGRRLGVNGRQRIVVEVRETNLAAQMFFSACGYLAIGMKRERYVETCEDAFVFEFRAQ